MQLILASASIGREYLLKGLKIPYRIIPSHIDEDKIMGKNLIETVKLRAKVKGEEVAEKIIKSTNQPIIQLSNNNEELLILSADTEVIINNQLLGKPKDYQDAVKMLRMLSGKMHEVVSGYYIIETGNLKLETRKKIVQPKIWQGFDRSFVTFRKLKDEDIKQYLSVTEYTRYTGSYALIASPQNFITKIEGSISNVIGLPLEKVIPIFSHYNLLTNHIDK